MADYKGIKGFTIQTIAGDPPAPIVGQVWYNTTSNVLKGYVESAGAWASTPNVNTGRSFGGAVGGPPAALFVGGGPGTKTNTESWDGSTWTNTTAMNTGRQYTVAFGSTTAAVVVAGNPGSLTTTEIWNGAGWTNVPGVLSVGRQMMGSSNTGTTTAGLIFAGENAPGPPWYSLALAESWNGSSWSVETAVSTVRQDPGGVGTSTASLCITGYDQNPPSGMRTQVEEWNGTGWSEETAVNTGRQAVCCAGTTTSAMIGGGGDNGATGATEQWNGTSWTEVADMGTGRAHIAKGAGASGNACIACSGNPNRVDCESWDGAPTSTVTFTSS